MYLHYYGFSEDPFDVTSNPRFFFNSESHEDALAHLLFGVENHKGFLLLSGEVGTGKTTVLNALLDKLDATWNSAFVFNSGVDFLQLMRFVCHDLGIKEQVEGRFDAIRVISDYLLEQSEKKNSVLVVIDEAQNLSVETLEELRMLSNLEAYNQKLLQIVLAGQPELVEKLERQELRQLNQRIAIRFRLGVLDAEETAQYVQHRLHVADCSAQLFDAAALKLIHKTSQGVPRLINQLCSAGLLRAMTMGKKRVRLEVMQEVLANECASIARRSPARIQIERTGGPRWLWPAISLCLLAVLLMVLLRPVREPAQPVAVIQQQAQSASAVETAQRGEMSAVSVALDTLRAEVETVIQEPATRQAEPEAAVMQRPEEGAPFAGQPTDWSAGVDLDVVLVRPGDTISGMLLSRYGTYSWGMVEFILRLNPGINNANEIKVGSLIRLPREIRGLEPGTKEGARP